MDFVLFICTISPLPHTQQLLHNYLGFVAQLNVEQGAQKRWPQGINSGDDVGIDSE